MLMTLILLTGPLLGCAKSQTDSYCDIAGPIYIKNRASVNWLLENDRKLLEAVVINNETYGALCM